MTRMYFAGSEYIPKQLDGLGIERALIAFSTGARMCAKIHAKYPHVFLDSGAFSAFRSGTKIDLGAYCDLIQTAEWDAYAALDVIGDPVGTQRNADKMIKRGLEPVVAFHHGSDYKVLDKMCAKYPYIALGGLVPISTSRRRLEAHLDACFSIIGKHWPVKVHGFGMVQPWALERYPFYSVDATSWMYGYNYMMVQRDDGTWSHMKRWAKRERMEKDARRDLSVASVLTQRVSDEDKYIATRRNIRMALKLEQRITRLWAARNIIWEDDHL